MREAEFASLRQEHAKSERAIEAGVKNAARLEADLRTAHARADAAAADLDLARDGAAALDAQLKLTASQLNAVRTEFDALKADTHDALSLGRERRETGGQVDTVPEKRTGSGVLLAQLARVQKEFDAADSFVDKMRSNPSENAPGSASRAPRRVVPPTWDEARGPGATQGAWQPHSVTETARSKPVQASWLARLIADGKATAQRFISVVRTSTALRSAGVQTSALLRSAAAQAFGILRLAAKQTRALRPPSISRTIGVGAVVLLAAVAFWFLAHHKPAPLPSAEAAVPNPGTVIHDCPDCPAMTVLPAGRFKQGSARTDNVASSFEKPQHWVNIQRAFAMSTNTVTVDQFRRFIAASGLTMEGCDTYDGEWQHRAESNWQNPGFVQSGTHPVTCVSFNDATAYAQWLSTRTGHRYRLPSASEWEYAAFAGSESGQPWGRLDSGACAAANVADQSAARQYPGWQVFPCDDGYVNTSPVGSFKANAFGINDTFGNLLQWTEDCWYPDYTGAPVDGTGRTDGDCTKRELRGGSWFSKPAYVRATYRNHFAADYRTSSVGIRLVREIGP